MVFSTFEDLRSRWPQLEASESDVQALLEDASLWVATMYAIPEPVGDRLGGVLRMIVCAMVKRALLALRTGNVASQTHTAGPFTEQLSYSNADGNFYLTSAEKDLLEAALDDGSAGSGMVSVEAVGW